MDTGESTQGLRKILELTRIISIIILLLHFYYTGYDTFESWNISSKFTDQLIINVERTGLLDGFRAKIFAAVFLFISFLGSRGRKNEKLKWMTCVSLFSSGLAVYFFSDFFWNLDMSRNEKAKSYIVITSIGYLLMIAGGTLLSRIINWRQTEDIFNKENETFPQEERLLQNEYSINLPTTYKYKGKMRKGWINIINPFRGTLVCGNPGSGKTIFVIRNVIQQHLQKGFAMFIYDFKYDDLTSLAYNLFQENKDAYNVRPEFCIINFDDLSRSHRCNPLDPDLMFDITDASESARTIMLGLNREWIRKQGDFWVESPIIFLTAIIWYLKKFNGGEYCTLPHVIELLQVDYEKLFSILRMESEIEPLVNPFVTAYLNNAMEQLEGQIAGAKIAMARLASPQLYYVMSGKDFTLDINDPKKPKIFCAGNTPEKIQTYGAVLSLFVNRMIKLVNRKGGVPCSLIFDEFPTLYLNNIDTLIATARSNKISTTLAVQDLSQLKKDYGKEQADVIMNIMGNVIAGQVTGETADQLTKRFGRINQSKQSFSVSSNNVSISKSKNLDSAVPASAIGTLSSGEFVGLVADNPGQRILKKIFHAQIGSENFMHPINRSPIPDVQKIDKEVLTLKYRTIKSDIEFLVESQLQIMVNSPGLISLVVCKKI
ncbi:MAG: type IV secretory system conjugative DNA transfer family protein [Bacteroidetes bacterium]|nr:type IV secretory system conjugative DNA transfer family protein [Bacteroidota bacterium]